MCMYNIGIQEHFCENLSVISWKVLATMYRQLSIDNRVSVFQVSTIKLRGKYLQPSIGYNQVLVTKYRVKNRLRSIGNFS